MQTLKNKNGQITIDLPEMVGKKDVFISYKRENAQFAIRLYQELHNNGINAWIDIERLHHETGNIYRDKIHAGIKQSELFLLLYTKDVEESDFIINEELKFAIENKKTILFYPQDKLPENSRLIPYVRDIQWLDNSNTAAFQLDTQEALYDEEKRVKLASLTDNVKERSIYDDQNLFLIRIAIQRKLGLVTKFGAYKKLCGVKTDAFYDNSTLRLTVENVGFFLSPPQKYYERLLKLNFFTSDSKKDAIVSRHIELCNIDRLELFNRLSEFLRKNSEIYSYKSIVKWFERHSDCSELASLDIPEEKDFSIEKFIEIVTELTSVRIISDIDRGINMFNGTELGVLNISDSRTPDVEMPIVEMSLYYSDYFTFKCMTEMFHILCSINGYPFGDVSVTNIHEYSPFLCSLGLGGFLAVNSNGKYQLVWTKRGKGISSGDVWHFSYDETVSLLKDSPGGESRIVLGDDGKVHLSTNEILYRALKEELGIPRSRIVEDFNGVFEIGLIQSERLEVELISSATLHLEDERTPIFSQIKSMYDTSSDGYLEVSKFRIYPLHGVSHLVGKLINPEAMETADRLSTRLRENIGKRTKIGDNTIIEYGSFIDDGAEIGYGCKIHRNVYVGKGVHIGNYVKIQNNNSIYPGVTLHDGVFIGTNVSFVNDRYPRSIKKSDGKPVDVSDWVLEQIEVKEGASIGAGATILCGVTIGEWSMVGCGAVVVDDVPPYATVVGNPARVIISKESFR